MARFEHEYDRDKAEQGTRVALDITFENSGYKEDRIGEVTGRAADAAELRRLTRSRIHKYQPTRPEPIAFAVFWV
jgi:hypothetical protein